MHTDIHDDNLLDEKCLSRKRQIFYEFQINPVPQTTAREKKKLLRLRAKEDFSSPSQRRRKERKKNKRNTAIVESF